MSLKNTAQETLNILKTGKYTNSVGKTVEFLAAQQMAVTIVRTPFEKKNGGTEQKKQFIA